MSGVSLYITVASCAGNAARRDACRRTWLAELPPGVSYAFYVGEGAEAAEPDTLHLPAPDGYRTLPQKSMAALRAALDVGGWDFLLDVDDDTAVEVPRVLRFLEGLDPARPMLCGHHGRVQPHRCLGGAGMLYTRAGARAIVADTEVPPTGAEDRALTEAALRQGVAVEFSPLWGFYGTAAPWLTRERLTAVNMEPADMLSAWAARARQGSGTRLAMLPPHLRPQGRSRAAATARQAEPPAATADPRKSVAALVLRMPRGVQRVVVLSNVVQGWPAERIGLRAGDLCIHLNRAAHAAEAMAVEGVHHWLLCRHAVARAALGYRWYTPASMEGFERVLFLHDAELCAGLTWWAEWRQLSGGKPATTGFIAANICRDLWPELPLVLAGFAPGVYHGTPLWSGHAWQLEAAWYARKNFNLIPPTDQ